jgi:hypothetical protein
MNDMNPVASSRFMKYMPSPSTGIGDLRQNGTIAIRHFHSDLAADQQPPTHLCTSYYLPITYGDNIRIEAAPVSLIRAAGTSFLTRSTSPHPHITLAQPRNTISHVGERTMSEASYDELR